MRKSVLALLCFCLAAIAVNASGQSDVYRKWMEHVEKTYYIPMVDNLNDTQKIQIQVDPTMLARVMGYALSMQLKFIRRDTSEHRIWKRLEEKSRKALEEEARIASIKAYHNNEQAQQLKEKILREFAAATVGWHDKQMAALTFVHQENAPNFFDILDGQSGQQQTGNQQIDEDDPVDSGNTDSGNQTYPNPDPDPDPIPDPDPYSNQRDGRERQPWDAILGEWTFDEGISKLTILINHDPSGDSKKYSAHIVSAGSWQQDRGYNAGDLYGVFSYHTTRSNGEILFYLAKVDQKKTDEANGRVVYVNSALHVILRPLNNQMSIGKNRRYSRWYR